MVHGGLLEGPHVGKDMKEGCTFTWLGKKTMGYQERDACASGMLWLPTYLSLADEQRFGFRNDTLLKTTAKELQ